MLTPGFYCDTDRRKISGLLAQFLHFVFSMVKVYTDDYKGKRKRFFFSQLLRKLFLLSSDRCFCLSLPLSFLERVSLKRVYLVSTGGHVPLLSKVWFLNFAPLSFRAKMIVF